MEDLSHEPIAIMVLVHTVTLAKRNVDDSVSDTQAPAGSSKPALGDAESTPADLTAAATTTTSAGDDVVQDAFDSSKCPEWAKRWLQETQGKAQWGFARYIDHGDIRKRLREEDRLFDSEIDKQEPRIVNAYKARTEKFVKAEHQRIGYGKALSRQFRLQGITWPQSSVDNAQCRWDTKVERARIRDLDDIEAQAEEDEDNELDLDSDELRRRDDLELLKQKFLDGDVTDRFEDDACLRAKFQVLRNRFKTLRDKPRDAVIEKDAIRKGLRPGLLDNVFIVVDKACMDSYQPRSGTNDADQGWVFAVDPDYKDPGPMEPLASKVQDQYRGFIRVRLYDLLDDFFVVRRFHKRERPMDDLWRQAQKVGNGLFVPTAKDE